MEKEPTCSVSKQMLIIMRRAFKEMLRNPMKLRNQIVDVIVSIVIIGCVFYMTAKDPPPDFSPEIEFFNYLMDVEGAIFMGVVAAGMSGVYANLLVCNLFVI